MKGIKEEVSGMNGVVVKIKRIILKRETCLLSAHFNTHKAIFKIEVSRKYRHLCKNVISPKTS